MKKSIPVLTLFFLLVLSVLSTFSFAQSWAWANSAGGPQRVESYAITIDNSGNSYITGRFQDSLKFGSFSLVASVSNDAYASDIFIAKYDSNGGFIWAKRAGGTAYDYGNGIATDAAGNVFVIGLFSQTATFGTLNVTTGGDFDIFIAKYNPSGTCQWVNKAGGTGWDVGNGVAIDNAGNCFITGAFRNTATFSTTPLTSLGNYDAFVAKYNNSGVFQWAKSAGGTGDDRSQGISTDAGGNCYVTGFFNGNATIGTTPLTSAGSSDIWIAKYNGAGVVSWAKRAGGALEDAGNAIYSDDGGNTHVTGFFDGAALFGSGLDTVTLISAGNKDVFAGKYDNTGDLMWMKKFGGSQNDIGYAISVDSSGNSYVAGSYYGTALFDTIAASSISQEDAFVAGMNYYGKTKWVASGGGGSPDIGTGVAASKSGSCYTTGFFSGSATFGTNPITGFADNDLFIAKLDSVFTPIIGIKEESGNLQNIVIYPNPFNTDVTIQFESSVTNMQIRIELFDILGKNVTNQAELSEIKSVSSKKQVTIYRGSLPDGLYFGKVIVGNKIYTARLVLIN